MSEKNENKCRRSRAELARRVGLKSRSQITRYLKYGYGASPSVAARLAQETGTYIKTWLSLGNLKTRQKAYARWRATPDPEAESQGEG